MVTNISGKVLMPFTKLILLEYITKIEGINLTRTVGQYS